MSRTYHHSAKRPPREERRTRDERAQAKLTARAARYFETIHDDVQVDAYAWLLPIIATDEYHLLREPSESPAAYEAKRERAAGGSW